MAQIQVAILVFIRMMSFVILSPVFSQRTFPNLAKVVLGATLTIACLPTVLAFEQEQTLLMMIVFSFKEVLLGLAMGYLSQLVFTAVEIAGQLIDFQVGFSLAQAYDPTWEMSSSPFGKVYYWIAVSVFFMLNLHHRLILALVESLRLVPIGTVDIPGITIRGVVKLFSQSFEMAVNLAAPIVLTLLVVDFVLGILSRSIPQINLLMLSMSLKTAISFGIFLVLLPNALTFLSKQLPNSLVHLQEFIRSLS